MIVNITNIISEAFRRTMTRLFRPFNLSKWLVFGLAVFTIFFSESNFGGNLTFPGKSFNTPKLSQAQTNNTKEIKKKLTYLLTSHEGTFIQRFQKITGQEIDPHTLKVITIVVVCVMAFVVIASFFYLILVNWLRARMEFILLDNLVHDATQVQWRFFAGRANSFLFNYLPVFLLFIITVIIIMILLTLTAFSWGVSCLRADTLVMPQATTFLLGVLLIMALVVLGIVFNFYQFIAFNILIPVMYHRDIKFKEALGIFMKLIRQNLAAFAKLWLMSIVISIAYAFIIMGAIMLLLAIFFLIMLVLPFFVFFLVFLIIPLMFGVALLYVPYYVFIRNLGPGLLARLDPELNIFEQNESLSS